MQDWRISKENLVGSGERFSKLNNKLTQLKNPIYRPDGKGENHLYSNSAVRFPLRLLYFIFIFHI